ncbi:MAG: hypothetical protein ABEJ07_01185 [Candidatus Nanohaloarchaea archaeon]
MPDSASRGWRYLEDRFGVTKECLEDHRLKEVSGDLWLVSEGLVTGLDVETYGIRFIRIMDVGLKPTTYGLQLIGRYIQDNVVELERQELVKLLRREEMVEGEMESKGYVALRYEDRVIGCGFYKNGKVSSRVPKGRGKELLDILT